MKGDLTANQMRRIVVALIAMPAIAAGSELGTSDHEVSGVEVALLSVKRISVFIPGAQPFEDVPIAE